MCPTHLAGIRPATSERSTGQLLRINVTVVFKTTYESWPPTSEAQQSNVNVNLYETQDCLSMIYIKPFLLNASERSPFEHNESRGILPLVLPAGIAGRNHPSTSLQKEDSSPAFYKRVRKIDLPVKEIRVSS